MNATVTARVPQEIKAQVDLRLREIGSSATELINAAYEYVLKTGSLPESRPQSPQQPGGSMVKALSAEQLEELQGQWRARAILGGERYDGGNFRDLLNEARDDYHARLA